MIKVYVAGPYTKGDVCINVKKAIDIGEELIQKGFCPYIPHLTHFQHLFHPHTWQEWLDLDFEWIKQCDYLLRISGESLGADKEVEFAKQNNITVVSSVNDLLIRLDYIENYGTESTL